MTTPSGNGNGCGCISLQAAGGMFCLFCSEACSCAERFVVQERLGYSLDVKASAIGHREAGDGLWLRGQASLGSLVALYPGIAYSSSNYRWEELGPSVSINLKQPKICVNP